MPVASRGGRCRSLAKRHSPGKGTAGTENPAFRRRGRKEFVSAIQEDPVVLPFPARKERIDGRGRRPPPGRVKRGPRAGIGRRRRKEKIPDKERKAGKRGGSLTRRHQEKRNAFIGEGTAVDRQSRGKKGRRAAGFSGRCGMKETYHFCAGKDPPGTSGGKGRKGGSRQATSP